MVSAVKSSIPVWFSVLLLVSSCGPPDSSVAESEVPAAPTAESADSAAVTEGQPVQELHYIRAAHILIRSGVISDSLSEGAADRTAQESITRIRSRILSGDADFREMAAEYSECPSSAWGGVLPAFTPGAVAWPLDSAASSLEPGGISGVLRTRAGYHIVMRLED